MQAETITINPAQLTARQLTGEYLKPAASVLYLAYHDDPLFMEIFRADKPDYEQRLRAAIREELSLFWEAGQPLIGVFYDQQLLGVACVVAPDSGLSAGRLWHWRLKMLLTAGFVSTRQLLEKEKRIHDAMPAERYHMLAFIAVSPRYQHLGLGHYLLHAVDSVVGHDGSSAGIGVFVTIEKNRQFFSGEHYLPVAELVFGQISGTLMFRKTSQQ